MRFIVEVWEVPVMPGAKPLQAEPFATREEAVRFAANVEAEGPHLQADIEQHN